MNPPDITRFNRVGDGSEDRHCIEAAPILLAMVLVLGACSTSQPSRFSDAATAPLADFNVGQASIPPLLLEARKTPYGVPLDQSCAALLTQVQTLDSVLGPDIDVPSTTENLSTTERGMALMDDGAVSAFKGAVEGLVPYRGWVRRLSGAERHSKEIAAAMTAGNVRRAFLKGLSQAHGCP